MDLYQPDLPILIHRSACHPLDVEDLAEDEAEEEVIGVQTVVGAVYHMTIAETAIPEVALKKGAGVVIEMIVGLPTDIKSLIFAERAGTFVMTETGSTATASDQSWMRACPTCRNLRPYQERYRHRQSHHLLQHSDPFPTDRPSQPTRNHRGLSENAQLRPAIPPIERLRQLVPPVSPQDLALTSKLRASSGSILISKGAQSPQLRPSRSCRNPLTDPVVAVRILIRKVRRPLRGLDHIAQSLVKSQSRSRKKLQANAQNEPNPRSLLNLGSPKT